MFSKLLEMALCNIRVYSLFGEEFTFVTRLRLDAAFYQPAPARVLGRPGRNRKKE